jgi:nucleoside-diphosphate-sugar epimerase
MSNITQHTIIGTGPLGMAVMRELISRGIQVNMVNTRGQAEVPPEVKILKADAYSAASIREATKDSAVVYQCAQPHYHEWPQKFPNLQASILEGVAANNAKLVIADNLYMYGETQTKIHENLPNSATTRKGRTRADMAEAALAAHKSGKLRVVIGRGSDFFGPGVKDSALGDRAIEPVLKGKTAQLIGIVDMPHTYTFIDDFGKALVVLGEHDDAFGQVWHVPNDRPAITQRELLEIFFKEAGHAPKMSGAGQLMLRMVGLFVPGAYETVEMLYEFEKPFVVDSSKFEQIFGIHATPIEEAVRRTLAWYKAELEQGSTQVAAAH